VQSGGAVLDNNGFDLVIGQPLLNGGGTDGGLTCMGTGSWTLTGPNTYNGSTMINSGRLKLSDSGSISNSAGITVAGGATFDVSGVAFALGGSQILSNSTPTATLYGSVDASVGTVSMTYAAGTPAFAVGNGTLTLSGSTVVNVNNTGPALTAGSYEVISNANGGTVAGTVPTVVVSGLSPGASTTLQTNSDGLYLVVTGGAPPPLRITGISLSGTTLNLTAVNGAVDGPYVLLQSTNIALPLNQWARVLTNNFDDSGQLNLSTNIISPGIARQFYILLQ
jgi:autotransporter-associated beta strand protein